MTFTEYITMRLSGILEGLQFCWPIIAFGTFTGCFTGLLSTRRGLGLEGAMIKSLLISITPPLAFFFVVGLYGWQELWPTPKEWSIGAAIKAGVVYMIYLGVGLASVGAISTLLFCLISYFGSKRCEHWSNRKKKPKAHMSTPSKPSDKIQLHPGAPLL